MSYRPPCLHADWCAFYGCPFEREPSSIKFPSDGASGARSLPLGSSSPAVSVRKTAIRFKFGCVPTGPNLLTMPGRKAIAQNGPQSRDLIARCGVTAAAYSRVAA